MGASVAVLGASGYAGGELLRLLARHPAMSVAAVAGESRVGEAVGLAHPHLSGSFDLQLVPWSDVGRADVCFSCLPHGVLTDRVHEIDAEVVVDLADDFRADPDWVYGLPELDRPSLRDASRIANPGCYPTATLLCLVPFARAGLISGPVVVDALSGVTGAGRTARDELLFGSVDSNAIAYGTVEHRHVPEMERGLSRFGLLDVSVSFTPHLVPMARGLLVTARARWLGDAAADPLDVLHDAYGAEPFVHVGAAWPSTKPVVGTNNAMVSARLDVRNGFVICSAAIDNLGKGAAGQAIQNANVALGLDESLALEAVATWP